MRQTHFSETTPKEKILWTFVSILLIVFLIQGLSSAWTFGQTIDETFYNGSGYPIVRYNNYEFLGEHPPLIIQLGALPLLLLQPRFPIDDYVRLPNGLVDISKTGAQFLYEMGNNPHLILFAERIPMVLLATLLGFGIFRFGRELYGNWGALIALALFVFTPDMIANASVYMTDMGLTVFYFFAIYGLKKFFDEPSFKRVLIAGIVCGLAFISKISSLILIPIISFLFLTFYASNRKTLKLPAFSLKQERVIFGLSIFMLLQALGSKLAMLLFGPFLIFVIYLMGRDMPIFKNGHLLGKIFRLTILSLAVLLIVFCLYLKQKFSLSMAIFGFIGLLIFICFCIFASRWASSDPRIRLLKYFLTLWVFADLVIILDYTDFIYQIHQLVGFNHYMKPLKIVLSHMSGGHGSCIPGSFVTCDWKYFPTIMAIKTPLLVLFLSSIGIILLVRSSRPSIMKAILLLPLVIFLMAAMANKINLGLRHIIPIYPFLFLVGGLAGARLMEMKPSAYKKILVLVFSIFLTLFAIRTLTYMPDYVVYFNEAIGNAERGAKIMITNWGQDNKALAEFVLEKKIPFIKISGEVTNPDVYNYYKINWEPTEESEWTSPPPGYYALGLSTYMNQQDKSNSWFKGKTPLYRVGKTYYIFHVL